MAKKFQEFLRRRAGFVRGNILLGCASGALLTLALLLNAAAVDTDNDGMSDFYENLFGLNPTDALDALIDSDSDSLTNIVEYGLATDPFRADTDRDGWPDNEDQYPVSRLYIDWGAPQFTSGDQYLYTGPDWWAFAFKDGGSWSTNPISWHVPASASNGVGRLNIQIDRAVLTNNLVLAYSASGSSGAVLKVDLLNSNGVVVATNLAGNLITAQNTNVSASVVIPLVDHAAATWIRLARESGDVRMYETRLYIDEDGDGLDDGQEAQLGTSDRSTDSDGDGLTDSEETILFGTNPALADTDGDGLHDGYEVALGESPTEWTLYVFLPFIEEFEPSTVLVGDLNGQNNWVVDQIGAATVQSNVVFSGAQALQIAASGSTTASVRHVLTAPDATVVWIDFRAQALLTRSPDVLPSTGSALFYLDELQVVAHDGNNTNGQEWISFTNQPEVQVGSWIRYTVRLDYDAQEWGLFLNGVLLGDGLGFASAQSVVAEIELLGQWGFGDALSVSTNQPAALSFDGDSLPDDWEILYFGSTAQADGDDPDGDGLNNLEEYGLGTDPSSADSDGDGMPDGWELQNELDALSASDASDDPDADGLNNLTEFQAGTDPNSSDTDGDGLSDGDEVNVLGTDPLDDSGDADADGMPDTWEALYGLNPTNSVDAGEDLDSDGLSNLEEYQAGTNPTLNDSDGDGLNDYDEVVVHQSNPLESDSDGDGMPDGWEIQNGTNINLADDNADVDADGANNYDEFVAGTNPFNDDSDGDGFVDGWETALGSDPLADESLGSLVTNIVVIPAQVTNTVGSWEVIDAHDIRASSRRGSVTYEVNVATPNVYVVNLNAVQGDPESSESVFYLRTYMDGEYLGQGPVDAGNPLTAVTPWLDAGSHTLTFYWNNIKDDTSLQITGISLGSYSAPDSNTNGVPDWVDNQIARCCTLEIPAQALISPLTIEGAAKYLSKMGLSADSGGGPYSLVVNRGVGSRWYADLPLSALPTDVFASFESGIHSISQTVVWTELNLLDTEAYDAIENERLYIRVGDSLRFSARGVGATNGSSMITVSQNGTNLIYSSSGSYSDAFPVSFAQPGTYEVEGEWQDGQTTVGSLTVEVIDGSFPVEKPVCWYQKLRNWNAPTLPEVATVEADRDVDLARAPLEGGGSRLDLTMNEIHEEHAVIARLPGGAILDGRVLHGTNLRATDNVLQVQEILPDGSLVVTKTVVVTYPAPDSEVSIYIFAGGIVFEDGSKRLLIGPEDLSDTGEYTATLIMSPQTWTSACHITTLLQAGENVQGR